MARAEAESAPWLNARAEELRRTMTPAAAALWPLLRALGFEAEVPIRGRTKNGGVWLYILDFALCPHTVDGPTICVEVDGSSHRTRKGRDRRRDTRLAAEGIRTVRVTNSEVLKHSQTVVEKIKEEMGRWA